MFIAGCIVASFGCLFLLIGIVFYFVGKSIWKCTAQVTGQVIDMCLNAFSYNNGGTGNNTFGVHVGGRSTKTRCPIFSYTVNGVNYTRASNVAWNVSYVRKKMQQPQTVYYNPQQPEQASLCKQSVFSILGKVFMLVGIALLGLGLVFILV